MPVSDKSSARHATRKPLDEEIDVFGLTHPGKVRRSNQDHFLICSLRKQMDVVLTSLPDAGRLPLESERLAVLAMVADGVGGGAEGGEASRVALETISEYVARSMHCYYTGDADNDEEFAKSLEEAALTTHAEVVRRAEENPDLEGMATTLTLWMGVWPRAYLLQVGDSRFYLLHEGELMQISRDQTMAQDLVDQGVLSRTEAFDTRWANVLSSSIGGRQTAPVVTRIDQSWSYVGLLCSDGLTKHVPDDRICERLVSMKSAKQVCRDLLHDALEGGGEDNVTVVVGRVVHKD